MDRILKERYKYTSLDRLRAFSSAENTLQLPHIAAVVETEAAACLCQATAPTAAAITLPEGPESGEVAGDPILTDNLAYPQEQVQGVQITLPQDAMAEGILYIHFRYPNLKPGKTIIRNTIHAGRNAHARIVVYHHHAEHADAVINALTVVKTQAGASVEVIEITETRAAYFGTILTKEHADSRVKVTTIDLDNSYLRRNQFVSLIEQGAECNLEGIYITDADQHADNQIRMHHAVPNCASDQLFKGIAEGNSSVVFTGQIYVDKDAQRTVALQQNHNIVLSDTAKVNTRPQLEIYADDVKCNHGATVGRLDPEAIYYMRQRGIGIEAARRLQIEGFVDEIIDRTKVEDLQHLLRDKVSKRMQNI